MKVSFLALALFLSLISCNVRKNEAIKSEGVTRIRLENKYDSTVLEEAFHKLKAGKALSGIEIETFSKNSETRANFYGLLNEFGQQSLFPGEYYTFEKASECPGKLASIPNRA